MYTWRRSLASLAALLAVSAPPALAQVEIGGVAVSGEATLTIGSRDESAYFNYTDYDHNALRMFRLALAAKWSPVERLAFLTEIRSEDAHHPIPYAMYVRARPFKDLPFDIQAGRIPPVFGAFARRSYATDNPLIGVPLAYQYLTSLRPDAIPATADDLLEMRGRGWLTTYPVGRPAEDAGVPLVTTYQWDTGVEGHAASRYLDVSVALTSGTLSNPRVDDDNRGRQISGRVAARPAVGLVLGASAARGDFLTREIADYYAAAFADTSWTQRAIGVDAEYSRGYFIVRGEVIHSRWVIPTPNRPFIDMPLAATAAFVEGRYRLSPRYFVAARVDRLAFSTIQGEAEFDGRRLPWDAPVTRIEAGGGVYLHRQVVARAVVQHNHRTGPVHFLRTTRTYVSAQLSAWF
jgi:hypothetical protein